MGERLESGSRSCNALSGMCRTGQVTVIVLDMPIFGSGQIHQWFLSLFPAHTVAAAVGNVLYSTVLYKR
jgi:hypothetical protein